MNTYLAARSAYSQATAPARNPRSIEYDLFARVTQKLAEAWAARRHDYPALIRALDENNRLWTVLAADVADPGNALPQQLRAQLFYLYEFTADHSRKVRAGDAEVGVLVDINTAVMRGLRGEGAGA